MRVAVWGSGLSRSSLQGCAPMLALEDVSQAPRSLLHPASRSGSSSPEVQGFRHRVRAFPASKAVEAS